MKKYIHNLGNAPIYIGSKLLVKSHSYDTASDDEIKILQQSNLPVEVEDNHNFSAIWIRNIPE